MWITSALSTFTDEGYFLCKENYTDFAFQRCLFYHVSYSIQHSYISRCETFMALDWFKH